MSANCFKGYASKFEQSRSENRGNNRYRTLDPRSFLHTDYVAECGLIKKAEESPAMRISLRLDNKDSRNGVCNEVELAVAGVPKPNEDKDGLKENDEVDMAGDAYGLPDGEAEYPYGPVRD